MKKTSSKPVVKPVSKPVVKQLPEASFRSGAIQATIWMNEVDGDNGKFKSYTFDFKRGYKDKNDEWKDTHNLRKSDIGAVQALLNKVSEYLLIDEDEEKELESEEEEEEEE